MNQQTRERVMHAFLGGASFETIASSFELRNADEAREVIRKAMAERTRSRDELVSAELARLDALMAGVWTKARGGDTEALNLVLKITDRRLKVLEVLPSGDAAAEKAEPAPDGVTTPIDEIGRRRASRGPGAKTARGSKVAND